MDIEFELNETKNSNYKHDYFEKQLINELEITKKIKLDSLYIYKECYSFYLRNIHTDIISLVLSIWNNIIKNKIFNYLSKLNDLYNYSLENKNNSYKNLFIITFLMKIVDIYSTKINTLSNCFVYIESKINNINNFNNNLNKEELNKYFNLKNLMHLMIFQVIFKNSDFSK